MDNLGEKALSKLIENLKRTLDILKNFALSHQGHRTVFTYIFSDDGGRLSIAKCLDCSEVTIIMYHKRKSVSGLFIGG